jgi:D-beta-D-heptose 7-phosphate kinase/D-beta-D-heptose 1-phosphate adenosyltransferase
MADKKIVSFNVIRPLCSKLRAKGKKIVLTNGCFDILHAGHVRYLKKAKAFGDILVVGLNSDRSVRAIKGPTRPVVGQNDRAEVLSALECVDYVTVFGELTPVKLIKAVRPAVLVKGADWKIGDIAGSDFVSSYGGKTLTVSLVKGRSTSGIIRKISRISR